MHHFFLFRLIGLLSHYGYAVLVPFAVIEGPLAAIVSGAFAASGEFDFWVVFLVLVISDLFGDSLYYALGRFGHTRLLQGIGAKIGITEERLAPLREGFKRNDGKIVLLGKTQALGSIVLYFAGATRMPFFRFLFWNLLGTLPKTLLFELVGFFFGQTLINSTRYLNELGIATFVLALLLLVGYWFVKRYVERELENS
jgi:membrane protein DedA with SNARE-associated domain